MSNGERANDYGRMMALSTVSPAMSLWYGEVLAEVIRLQIATDEEPETDGE